MLNILVVFTNVGEHVMHVVLGGPPLQRKTSQKCSFSSTEKVQVFISVMCGRVSNPTNQNLGEGKAENTYDSDGTCEADDPGCCKKQAEQDFD
jgi:hypothetical protein